MSPDNYYQLLSLQPTASIIEIKKRYRQLSLRFHPDHGESVHHMVKLNEAYSVLSNPLTRREYDRARLGVKQKEVTTTYKEASRYGNTGQKRPAQSPAYEFSPTSSHVVAHYGSRHRFWVWLGVVTAISICFLVYEVGAALQTMSNTQSSITDDNVGASTKQASVDATQDTNDSQSSSGVSVSQSPNRQLSTPTVNREWRRYYNKE